MANLKAFIIHGTGATSQSNWFPWLKAELEKMDITVFAPDFPLNEQQNLTNWLKVFEKYWGIIDENTLFIGHSLGPAFILNILERAKTEVMASFLVAPFIGNLNLPEFDKVNNTFVNKDFNWSKIVKNCRAFYVYASDNDPYVPLDKSIFIANKTNATLRIMKDSGHINADSGYLKFDKLLEDVKEVIQSARKK